MIDSFPAAHAYHVVAPINHPSLACRFQKPPNFKITELPPETPDFSKPTYFLALAIASSHPGPMVFSVGARPSFDDGSVSQWLDLVCRDRGWQRNAITETQVGNLPAVTCDALLTSDELTEKCRIFLFEDGGRLFNVNAQAPEPLWTRTLEVLQPIIDSFDLREPRGTTVALVPGGPGSPAPQSGPGRCTRGCP